MIRFHSCEAIEPVGVAKSPLTMMLRSRLYSEGVWEIGKQHSPPMQGICTIGLERLHIEENNIWVVIGHDAVDIFSADGTCICELSNLGFILCLSGIGCVTVIEYLRSIGFQNQLVSTQLKLLTLLY